jgi:Cof subfamily protein (haloacid dehalogenase superfamily)
MSRKGKTMIKLVATDVDGTLVKEGTMSLNPEYHDVIRSLNDKGIKVVFASGRQYKSISDLIAPVKDIVWYIADGGASVKMNGELEAVKEIPHEWVEEAFRDAAGIPGMDCLLCTPLKAYVPYENSQLYHVLSDNYGFNTIALNGWDKLPREPIIKLSLFRTTEIDKYASKYFVPKWKDRLHMSIAGEWWLDCVMPNINKGAALQKMMDTLGITASEVLATGDNLNDLEMIQLAGAGLAVSTAHPTVKDAALRIIPSFTQDGVLQEWKKLI